MPVAFLTLLACWRQCERGPRMCRCSMLWSSNGEWSGLGESQGIVRILSQLQEVSWRSQYCEQGRTLLLGPSGAWRVTNMCWSACPCWSLYWRRCCTYTDCAKSSTGCSTFWLSVNVRWSWLMQWQASGAASLMGSNGEILTSSELESWTTTHRP